MIYLLDSPFSETSHSRYITDIIRKHDNNAHIHHIPLSINVTVHNLIRIVSSLLTKVIPRDIVLCPWAVPANTQLDEVFEELSILCHVIAAAGNFSEPIEKYTPARTRGVITVGTLNKSGLVAALSNYSNNKEIIWVPGTNYDVGWKNGSGTSVSAAIYAAFLSRAIQNNDPNLLEKLLDEHKNNVYHELNNKA